MQQALKDLLRKRMDRSIATILSSKESTVDCFLVDDDRASVASRQLRKVVLDQFNDYYEVCLDVMDSLDNGEVVLNELYLKKIDRIHESLVASRGRSLEALASRGTGD